MFNKSNKRGKRRKRREEERERKERILDLRLLSIGISALEQVGGPASSTNQNVLTIYSKNIISKKNKTK